MAVELVDRTAGMTLLGALPEPPSDRELAPLGPGVLMIFDVDRLGDINALYGHAAGDRVLAETAHRVRHEMGAAKLTPIDDDAFACFLPLGTTAQAEHRAHRALRAAREPIDVDGVRIMASVSIALVSGGVTAPFDRLRARGVDALRQAKTQGGDRLVVQHDENGAEATQRILARDIAMAVVRGELRLEYQPLVRLDTGRVVRAEALLRWDHPQYGAVRPDVFIPLAERGGAIREISAWTLEQAIAQGSIWLGRGMELDLSVNLCVPDLCDQGLAERISMLLRRYGVPGERVHLEMTESTAVPDVAVVRTRLAALRAIGLRIALDDYGTGYSSPRHLWQLPLDTLKIDRSLVVRDERAPETKVVASTIALAHDLGLEVVAEGIEDPTTAARLRALGCDLGQGFIFGRPVPAIRFEAGNASQSDAGRAPPVLRRTPSDTANGAT